MPYIRPASERGHFALDWLDSYHSFSFGHYYDPAHRGFSVLRAINDDTVAPGAGFETHGHRDMEIVTYVLKGAIEHEDTLGNVHRLQASEVQRMTAGTGIAHSEMNASRDEPLRFLQIWIEPAQHGLSPGYEQKEIVQHGVLTPLVTPQGEAGSLHIQQDVSVYRLVLEAGEKTALSPQRSAGYLHVIDGEIVLTSVATQSVIMRAGDALGVNKDFKLSAQGRSDAASALWFDLPR